MVREGDACLVGEPDGRAQDPLLAQRRLGPATRVGFLLALVLFGVHLVALGALLYRSHYLPRVLGVLLVAAGVGYIADSLAALLLADHGGLVSAVLLTPAVVGELGPTAWLLLRGVTVPRPVSRLAG
jgi:hypothetical protein